MRILYIYRSLDSGPSIRRVFAPIEEELKKTNEVNSIFLPKGTASPLDIIRNVRFVKNHLRTNTYDIIHITGHVHYLAWTLRKYNTVITVHDLGFYTIYSSGLRRDLLYLFFIYPLKFAKKITYISEKSLEESNRVISIPPKKQHVIYNTIGSDYTYNKKVISCENPRILHLGTKPNKNLQRVLEAIAGIKCTLHVIGRLPLDCQTLVNKYKIAIINERDISDREIIKAYQDADVVCFPSLYEGFGMPILEGQAIGRPVVTSNLSPMCHISGGAAVLVDPYSVPDIRKGIEEALSNASTYIDLGLKNITRFRVKQIARDYHSIYIELVGLHN